MKKLVAIILTLAMLLCAGAALATEAEQTEQTEQTEAIVINWADIQEQGAETIAQGDFVTFDEIALKMWVPTLFEAVELTEDDLANGYIGYYQLADGSAAIAVMYVDAGGMTLEEYKEQATQIGATDIEDVVINGTQAMSYSLTESDTVCVSFVTENGCIFEVSGSPASDEEFASLLSIVMASIQAE